MDPIRVGHSYRILRVRKRWRQLDLAAAANVSRGMVSLVERGRVDAVPVGDLRRMAEALEADLDIRLRWNGEALDRLMDQAHADLVDAMVALLERDGWAVAIEVSFSMWGERGSVDVLALHPASGIVLVVEVKSVVPDSQSTLHGLDRKTRLAPEIAKTRRWACRGVARVLAIGDSSTSRRRVEGLATTYETAFPVVAREVRRWLRRPSEPISGLLFLPYARGTSTRTSATGVERVRKRGSTSNQPHMPVRRAIGNNERPGTR